MLKTICTDKTGLLRESTVREGMFVSTANSQVRHYKAGGPAKILALPVVRIDPDNPQQEILWLGRRRVAFQDFAVTPDQELLEVPADVAGNAGLG